MQISLKRQFLFDIVVVVVVVVVIIIVVFTSLSKPEPHASFASLNSAPSFSFGLVQRPHKPYGRCRLTWDYTLHMDLFFRLTLFLFIDP